MKKQGPAQSMYVYDRICPRESKRREILREYGTAPARQRYDRTPGSKPPEEHRQPPQQNPNRRPAQGNVKQSRAYNYRPGNAQGGEAVRMPPLKIVMDRILNLFVSVEDRGRLDESIARKQAIAWKKLVDHRWTIFITLLLLSLIALFVLAAVHFVFVIREIDVDGSRVYPDSEVIRASGIAPEDNLFSFDASSAEDQITFVLPMIRSAEITRGVPSTVEIVLTEDEPVFRCEIWGDMLMLSAGLRVLGSAEDGSSLPLLKLPEVDYSVAGRVLSFQSERDERYVRSVLTDVLASTLWSGRMVTRIDLADEYDLEVILSDMYILRLGDEEDCAYKLKLAHKTITYKTFTPNVPARIDVRNSEKAAVSYDPALVIE